MSEPQTDPAPDQPEDQGAPAATETDAPEGGEPKGNSLEDLLSNLDESAREAVLGEVKRARGEAAKYRTQLREFEPYKGELEKMKDANKSDLQRLEEARTAAENTASESTVEAARLRAALKHGWSEEDLTELGEFLYGTPEEIADRAEKLAKRLGAKPSAGTGAGSRPKEKLRGGGTRPDDEPFDPAAIAKQAREQF